MIPGSSTLREVSFDEYDQEQTSEAVREAVHSWLDSLEVRSDRAYALRYAQGSVPLTKRRSMVHLRSVEGSRALGTHDPIRFHGKSAVRTQYELRNGFQPVWNHAEPPPGTHRIQRLAVLCADRR